MEKLKSECNIRLTNLYNQSHIWLLKASYNICKNRAHAEDLVSDLYVYLSKECRDKIWWGDSYNLIYCQRFLQHRWMNRAPKIGRYHFIGDNNECGLEERIWEEYDYEKDKRMMKTHQKVLNELKKIKQTKGFAPAMLFEMYWSSDDTLQDVANRIGISKSTVVVSIKKIRNHLKEKIRSPFE